MANRTGTIYSEMYNNGKHPARGGLHNPGVISKTFRWVGEIMVDGKRFRFRSTNLANVQHWVRMMTLKYPNYTPGPRHHAPQASTPRRNSICHIEAKSTAGRSGRTGLLQL